MLLWFTNECNQRRLSKRYDHLRSKALLRNRRDFKKSQKKKIENRSTNLFNLRSACKKLHIQKKFWLRNFSKF